MPFNKDKAAPQHVWIETIKKLDRIREIKSKQEGLPFSRPAVIDYLANQELKRLETEK